MPRIYYLPDEPRVSEHAANVQLVASFSSDVSTITHSGYAAELREYENSQDYRHINSLMRERSAVKL